MRDAPVPLAMGPAAELRDSYTLCELCLHLRSVQDMALHVNICGTKGQEETEKQAGYMQYEQTSLGECSENRAQMRKSSTGRPPHLQRTQSKSTPNMRALRLRGAAMLPRTRRTYHRQTDEDSATLVDEPTYAARHPICIATWREIRPDLADRFPIIEPTTPVLMAVDSGPQYPATPRDSDVPPYSISAISSPFETVSVVVEVAPKVIDAPRVCRRQDTRPRPYPLELLQQRPSKQ